MLFEIEKQALDEALIWKHNFDITEKILQHSQTQVVYISIIQQRD